MSHVHICLVSDQTVPNILGIAELEPEEVVFCSSAGMERKGKTDAILAALRLHGRDYGARHQLVLVDHNSFDDCERALLKVREEYGARRVVVNLTGGTKVMALAAAGVFREQGTLHIYTPIPRNEYQQLHPRKRQAASRPLNLRLSVEAYATAYGVKVANSGGGEIPRRLGDGES